jgi:hypothetical protein
MNATAILAKSVASVIAAACPRPTTTFTPRNRT